MSAVEKYVSVMRKFVSGNISASEFEISYLSMFKNELETISEQHFDIINDLFFDVDSYCSDPNLRDDDDIDEVELLRRTKIALEALLI